MGGDGGGFKGVGRAGECDGRGWRWVQGGGSCRCACTSSRPAVLCGAAGCAGVRVAAPAPALPSDQLRCVAATYGRAGPAPPVFNSEVSSHCTALSCSVYQTNVPCMSITPDCNALQYSNVNIAQQRSATTSCSAAGGGLVQAVLLHGGRPLCAAAGGQPLSPQYPCSGRGAAHAHCLRRWLPLLPPGAPPGLGGRLRRHRGEQRAAAPSASHSAAAQQLPCNYHTLDAAPGGAHCPTHTRRVCCAHTCCTADLQHQLPRRGAI